MLGEIGRRRFLGTVGASLGTSLAGCLQGDDRPEHDGWPMHGYDAANTGYKPNATGPKNGVSGVWTDPVEYGSLTGGEQPNGPGSTPAVVDGVVYVGSLGKNSLLAYDAETGEELWRFGVEGSVRDDPAVADGHVYFHQRGDLYALDAETGELVWGVEDSRGRNPIVYDGKVYSGGAGVYTGAGPELQVFEAEDGNEVWSFRPKDSYAGRIAVSEGSLYVGLQSIYSLDAETGEEEWETEVEGLSGRKVVADGILYTAILADSGGASRAIDTEDGELIWEFGSAPSHGEPAVDENKIYYGKSNTGSDESFYALDKETGEEVWSQDISGRTVAVAGGDVYVALQDELSSSLKSLDARTGELNWSHENMAGLRTRPVVVDEKIYIGGDEHNIITYEDLGEG